jgi:HPt (histidine-containing phosphotransfer) domain-containing protein
MAQRIRPQGEEAPPPAISAAEFASLVEMIGEDLPEVVVDLLETYLHESHLLIQVMMDTPADAPTSESLRAVHSLKSSSASLGAMQLARLCETLETYLRGYGPEVDVAESVSQIVAEYERVCISLAEEKEQLLNY